MSTEKKQKRKYDYHYELICTAHGDLHHTQITTLEDGKTRTCKKCLRAANKRKGKA